MVVYRANMETAPGYTMHCNRHRKPGIKFGNVTVKPQMHGKMLLPHRDTQNRKWNTRKTDTQIRYVKSHRTLTWGSKIKEIKCTWLVEKDWLLILLQVLASSYLFQMSFMCLQRCSLLSGQVNPGFSAKAAAPVTESLSWEFSDIRSFCLFR